jgi:hypothetical protein
VLVAEVVDGDQELRRDFLGVEPFEQEAGPRWIAQNLVGVGGVQCFLGVDGGDLGMGRVVAIRFSGGSSFVGMLQCS